MRLVSESLPRAWKASGGGEIGSKQRWEMRAAAEHLPSSISRSANVGVGVCTLQYYYSEMKMCLGGKAGQLYRGHPGSQASVGSGCSEVLAERTRWKRGLTDVGSFVVESDTAKVMDDDAGS
ncbi:hypothetical protein CMUS01_00044 [Colletotrichum musicola]|uniref:Uncharacterized protein n=1 Tax=Colletotrichum musicola TaxID=2175873 RepID=A0A8H6P072_9PEZI|nr:hypothetical protein CMUS01_00044 [Colletotrichum musicola]